MAEALPSIQVEVAQSLGPRQTRLLALTLPACSTVADALRASHWLDDVAEPALLPTVGIWGRQVPLNQSLREGDRIELYRPLQVDPKEARRLRYAARGPKPRHVNGSLKR